ncbi:hypothetical protein L6164_004583 [Bauhinia variegata]|uniref:Uncharacterized protein n=1 Tax=Bauhinia variegata TaxID=167791 RepID=A0ACB9Q558_BAUVA|nr:hypothetical protein L6164_004583 [Bauhinia variegata]
MKRIFLITIIFVSCTQATSNPDLCMDFTSENRGLNPSNCTVQLSEGFDISITDANRKETDNYQLSFDSRKASRGRGAPGGENVNNRPSHMKSSAELLLSGKLYWISSLTLYANLALVFLFPF